MPIDFADLEWDDANRAVTADGPVTGEVLEYGPLGDVVARVGYREGLKHGSELRYFPDGKLRYEGDWVDGRSVGVHRVWHFNRQLKEERRYGEDGRLAEVVRWSEDGRLVGPR